MMVSFITKSNTFWLYSFGKDTHSFWSSLSNMVLVPCPTAANGKTRPKRKAAMKTIWNLLGKTLFQCITSIMFYEPVRSALNAFQGWGTWSSRRGTNLLFVPISGRQPCRLACISLCNVIRHTFHSPPLHLPPPTTFPFPSRQVVNADKRYPWGWPLPIARKPDRSG